MEYTVLVKVYFPLLETKMEVYIPTTKTVKYCIKLLEKSLHETISQNYIPSKNAILCNKLTGERYEKDKLIVDTDIRNGSRLVLL